MKFGDFLVSLQVQRKCKSIAELFNELGGESELKMSLRNFNLLAANKQNPSFASFDSIFSQLDENNFRKALLAFIESNSTADSKLLKFATTNISEPPVIPKESFWKKKEVKVKSWNKTQLTYLINNSSALRIYYKLIFYKKLKKSELEKYTGITDELIKLELAVMNGEFIECPPFYYKLPSYENDAPESVRLSNTFIRAIFESFVSLEGSDNQTITHVAALLSPENADKLQEEMNRIKKLLLEYAEDSNEKNISEKVPFVMMGFAKQLVERDFK